MKTNNFKELSYTQKIDYYANLNNMITINNGNSKTGKACLTLSMPTCCCREDAPCKQQGGGCYCLKGHQMFPSVLGTYYKNFRLWNENPIKFEKQINCIIEMNGLPLFRWFDAGDIPSEEYFYMMVRVAIDNPTVKFLCYTKKYDIINNCVEKLGGVKKIPENFTIRFSAWDKNWKINNPYDFPMAFVDFKNSSLNPSIPENCFTCRGGKETTCSACQVCFNKKVKSVKFLQH